jgi:class 3 adenylate cyclase
VGYSESTVNDAGVAAPGPACSSCGTELRENAKFCDECGAVVAAPEPAEYKQVTVLFADVVHSMAIAAAVGAERWRETMAALWDRSTAVVKRYGGTVDKFTGDGIMAVFGAPAALEDHAIRACLAAMEIQREAARLADDVAHRDGVDLALRVGLNSGQVIVGEIGSSTASYTAIGEQVGMAQRMESVAPSAGVMLSESTARLVESAAVLGEPEMVHIKGAADPVRARRLLEMLSEPGGSGPVESRLVGRQWEMSAIAALLERSTDGRGCVVGLVGPAGIGKSRMASETEAIAKNRSIEVYRTLCESHAREVPFNAAARLLREAFVIADLDAAAARQHVRARVADANAEDLLLLDDLLGIAEPNASVAPIDPDARRRRLTALINSVSLARTRPALFIIEDAHWIDEVSESMLAEFLAVVPQTRSLVIITYRPEYRGALAHVPSSHTITLAPLTDSESSELTDELMGNDVSVRGLAETIVARSGGNPFFAEEIVRDLTERGVLDGARGDYRFRGFIADVSVPATLQATIAARIDRLSMSAKRTLGAAAVIGFRFDTGLVNDLGVDPVLDELVKAELVDQVSFMPRPEFAFRHPLVRTVAYESQLKSDRGELHRRLAAAIQNREPDTVDENAALIAEHFQKAGELRAAYDWHMRAGRWATNRDFAAAQSSWERARQIVGSLPVDHPDRTRMGIAALTQLCGYAWRVHADISKNHFEELRALCAAVDDKVSLAIGMGGLTAEHMMHGRVGEASRTAFEQLALADSIGDPALTAALSFGAMAVSMESGGQAADLLRWSQSIIDVAADHPERVSIYWGSPLAVALASRGVARWRLGHDGWREDLDRARAMGRTADPMSRAIVMTYTYLPAISCGVLLPDDVALRDISEALQIAERFGNDIALGAVEETMTVALLHRDSAAERQRGVEFLQLTRNMCLQGRYYASELAALDVYDARETARLGDLDGAIPRIRSAVDEMFHARQFHGAVAAAPLLIETLLDRAGDGDAAEAEGVVERLAAAPLEAGYVIRDVILLRMRAMMARERGEESAYREWRDRYRAIATSLGFEGHMAMAEAMT